MILENNSKRAVVIIPAHNEEKSIGKLLDALTEGDWLNSYEVIVSCNGCYDGTASIVRSYPHVICLETSVPSKVTAINNAEKRTTYYPRVYVDADIVINKHSILGLIETLNAARSASIAVPAAIINTSKSSFLVRQFYRAWVNTRYFIVDGHGCGVYALNKKARQLFEEFPLLISDDGYVRHILPDNSIIRLESSHSQVNAPRDLHSLLKISTRSKLGNIQLMRQIGKKNCSSIKTKIFLFPTNYLTRFIYYGINLYAMIIARQKAKSLETYKWQRDETSR